MNENSLYCPVNRASHTLKRIIWESGAPLKAFDWIEGVVVLCVSKGGGEVEKVKVLF